MYQVFSNIEMDTIRSKSFKEDISQIKESETKKYGDYLEDYIKISLWMYCRNRNRDGTTNQKRKWV